MKSRRDDIDKFFDYGFHPAKRIIYIGRGHYEDEVDFEMAESAIKALALLDIEKKEDITILLNSPGGEEYAGLAIYDAIKSCRSHVTCVVYGRAMSMASIILQAADERIMSMNSRLMIHYGTWAGEDHPKIIYKWIEEGKRIDKWMENLYLEKIREKQPKFAMEKLKSMLNFDTILNAKETVKLGLADKVLEE